MYIYILESTYNQLCNSYNVNSLEIVSVYRSVCYKCEIQIINSKTKSLIGYKLLQLPLHTAYTKGKHPTDLSVHCKEV